MTDRARRKRHWPTIAAIVALTIIATVAATRRDRVFQPGQTIRYDDFFFTLRGVNRTPIASPGGGGQPAPMVEYVVRLTVDNRARRVPFRFANGSVVLVDPGDGRRYRVAPEAQRAYEEATGKTWPDPMILKAGESVTREYVFRLPAGVADPRLRIATGGWSGEVIDTIFFGIKEFRLP